MNRELINHPSLLKKKKSQVLISHCEPFPRCCNTRQLVQLAHGIFVDNSSRTKLT